MANPDIDRNVIVYLDNSNMFINAGQYAAQKYKFRVPSDVRCRVDLGKLVDLACDGRKALRAKLYGSEPPALDTVWKAIRSKSIEVDHFRRSTWNNREKETDAALTADAVDDLSELKGEAGPYRALILFSGDKDMLPVLRKAQKHGWAIEIWSFKSALAKELLNFGKTNLSDVEIHYIDDYFEKITFTASRWDYTRIRIPADRTIVLKFEASKLDYGPYGGTLKDTLDRTLTKVVEASSWAFHLPMMACWHDLDPDDLRNGSNINPNRKAPTNEPTYYHLALICVPPEMKDGKRIYDFNKLYYGGDQIRSHFAGIGCVQAQTFPQYKEWIEARRTAAAENVPIIPKPFDFKPVIHPPTQQPPPPKAPPMQPPPASAPKMQPPPVKSPITQSQVPQLQSPPAQAQTTYTPVAQQHPAAQVPVYPDEYEEEEQLEEASNISAEEFAIGVPVPHWVVIAPKQRRPAQRYSDVCVHGFRCRMGMGCRYFHTAEQKEFFREQTDPRKRRYYKFKPCWCGNLCPYRLRSHICPYAHGLGEANCGICGEVGAHWMDECPDNDKNGIKQQT